ncbi:mechanosensitive ion channel family protein [Nakamurella aerolata]|uniref:Mechanosensitive ion channel family protein n=1 Tax=Nakamurella aerolata TaxID=1656892 RepID=A0A849A7D7_9ACTN|nr:mechanosensitive ion channel family protein [Nakamurella aerolata]NNG36884.1 mechanosensitive ion channel family protein [Nakamurella aerolata]
MTLQQFFTLLLCAVLAGAGAWLLAAAVRRVALRRGPEILVDGDRLCRRALVGAVAAITTLSLMVGWNSAGGWQRIGVIVVIAAVTYLVVRSLKALEIFIFARVRIDGPDNKRRRRVRTQVTLLRRIVAAAVVLIALCAVLITFPALRTFGTSVLASAGLAGVVAGLAAQTTLGNVFAGLQLAFSDAVRIDDVVVVEGEWGWIEEMTLTYVVVRTWDERRLVLPTSYFVTTPFRNWTRNHSTVIGSVQLYLDYCAPMPLIRERAEQIVTSSPHWDGGTFAVQVVDSTEKAMVVRILASAPDGPRCFDLRCEVREGVLRFLQHQHPQALPTVRVAGQQLAGTGTTAGVGSGGEGVSPVSPADQVMAAV